MGEEERGEDEEEVGGRNASSGHFHASEFGQIAL